MGLIEKIKHTVFIPKWNYRAYICENGNIYIELINCQFFKKEDVRTKLGTDFTEEFYLEREQLFDYVEYHYKSGSF